MNIPTNMKGVEPVKACPFCGFIPEIMTDSDIDECEVKCSHPGCIVRELGYVYLTFWNTRPLPSEGQEVTGCGCCGGKMVFIRGRHPKSEDRLVCPTCLAERMDLIREYVSPDYGKAFTANNQQTGNV